MSEYNLENFGRAAFEAYCKKAPPRPAWEDLPQWQREAWIAAAVEVMTLFSGAVLA